MDQLDQIKLQQSDGSLNVFFEENSEIAEFDYKVFAWKNTLNLYFCEAVSITYNDPTQFEDITNLNFYSKVQFSLPSGQQSTSTNNCYHLPPLFSNTKEKSSPLILPSSMCYIFCLL